MSGRTVRSVSAILVLFSAVACDSSDRPRELSLDGVEPCDLVSQSELRGFQVEAPPQPVPGIAGSDNEGTSCLYSPLYGGTVSVGAITNHGIGRWTDGSMESSRAVELARVEGYRAIRTEVGESASGPHESCTAYVDVASDQSLTVRVSGNSPDDPRTCETARRFAGAAIRELAG